MQFEDALKAMREGKRVQRKNWKSTNYTLRGCIFNERNNMEEGFVFSAEDVLAEDWVIVQEGGA